MRSSTLLLLVIGIAGCDAKMEPDTATSSSATKIDPQPVPASMDPIAGTAPTQNPEDLCRVMAEREYPNDAQMQQFVYNQQIAAYRYMAAVTDTNVKEIALREYPEDFAMQKFTYDQQSAAKRYMRTVSDAQVNELALREYPHDYAMQKFTYDQQLAAKN